MKELTDQAAITDAVYEMNLNGSYPIVKLLAVTVDIKEHEAMHAESHGHCCKSSPNIKRYGITRPQTGEKALYNQPLPAGGEIPVYNGGKPLEEDESMCRGEMEKGASRITTSKGVMARGPQWIWAAVAVGIPPEGSSFPHLVVEGAGIYGSFNTTEGEMIGMMDGRQREMTARLVRRAHLLQLPVVAIRIQYAYTFVEQDQYGKAKVKEG